MAIRPDAINTLMCVVLLIVIISETLLAMYHDIPYCFFFTSARDTNCTKEFIEILYYSISNLLSLRLLSMQRADSNGRQKGTWTED